MTAACRVTVLAAPAGSGKTVACSVWAGSAGGRVGWLTLDETDNDATLLRTRVTSDVDVLVIDDVHVLTDDGALRELDRVISHTPRVILSGRFMPGLHLAKLRVADEVADLGAADLACTAAEADSLLAALGAAVRPAERDALLGYTRGWITGLRLAALTGHGAGFGAQPLAADYLRDEVLDVQPPHIRLFMLRTSVAERLTGDIADSLSGGQVRGAAVLDTLARQNCFVDRLGGGEYRYYPVLRDMLLAELARRDLDESARRDPAGLPVPDSPVPQQARLRAPLSQSELAVLRLLPSFLTNQEIADALFLSVNTVKTHLRSIYRKLAVTSRRQAIMTGRRLQLLLSTFHPWRVVHHVVGWGTSDP